MWVRVRVTVWVVVRVVVWVRVRFIILQLRLRTFIIQIWVRVIEYGLGVILGLGLGVPQIRAQQK